MKILAKQKNWQRWPAEVFGRQKMNSGGKMLAREGERSQALVKSVRKKHES